MEFVRHIGRRTVACFAAITAVGAATVALAGPAIAAPPPSAGCAQVETIAVRGTTERQGGGSVAGPLASALQQQLPQTVRTHDLVYPASFNYRSSVRQGVSALRARLTQTAAQCPGIDFVLIGFSQGAQVVGDTLASGDVPGAGQIEAAVFFGDPTFNGNESYEIGSYQEGRGGIYARPAGALSAFEGVIGSYCNGDDSVCQRGANGSGHYRYRTDRQAAVDFVRAELG